MPTKQPASVQTDENPINSTLGVLQTAFNAYRARALQAKAGEDPGPEANMLRVMFSTLNSKLGGSDFYDSQNYAHQAIEEIAIHINCLTMGTSHGTRDSNTFGFTLLFIGAENHQFLGRNKLLKLERELPQLAAKVDNYLKRQQERRFA